MEDKGDNTEKKGLWGRIVSSKRFHDFWLFIPFLVVAAVFWFIIALDDEMMNEYEVGIEIEHVPDSVTFITDPPAAIRVNVRDKGTMLVRRFFMSRPVVRIDFRTYASNGMLRISRTSLQQFLHNLFGNSVTVLATDPDSVCLPYTTSPAREVPIRVVADVSPAIGKVVGPKFMISPATVKVYSRSSVIDTLQCVYTVPIVRRDVEDPLKVEVNLRSIPGCRIEPPTVTVNIPVEPLENRKAMVDVKIENLPRGRSLMVYPRKVEVAYLAPISARDVDARNFVVVADYNDVARYVSNYIPVRLQTIPDNVVSANLLTDSVEYSVLTR